MTHPLEHKLLYKPAADFLDLLADSDDDEKIMTAFDAYTVGEIRAMADRGEDLLVWTTPPGYAR